MAIDPTAIQIGPGDIWIGVTNPASPSTPLALDANGAPSSGTHVGLTEGPATFSWQPRFDESKPDISDAVASVFANVATMDLSFRMKELTIANLLKALPASTQQSATMLTFGKSGGVVTTFSVALIAPRIGTSPQRFTSLLLYKAYTVRMDPVQIGKAKAGTIGVTMRGIGDFTRESGDLVAQLVRQAT